MNKYQEFKSWLNTFIADLLIDLASGILMGLGTLAETGSYTTAAIMAVVVASARSVLKMGLTQAGKKLQEFKK